MFSPETSRHFKPFADPVTGVVSYVLKTRVAAQQQGFYFVNPSMDDACRYLWFYCFFPPASYATLGVVDFEDDEVRHFPETQYLGGACPLVDTETGECLFGGPGGFYRRGPKAGDPLVKICGIPAELRRGHLTSTATHLTYSPDKTELFVDANVSDRWITGSLRLSDGRFTVWREWDYCKNHAQFNPVDPNLALLAEDFWADANGTPMTIRYNDRGEFMRLWTLERVTGRAVMHPPLNGCRATHEWWSADGQRIYYCAYIHMKGNQYVASLDIKTGEHKVFAPVPAWHAFASKDDSYLVYDENDVFYRGTASRVGIYDRKTGRQLYIVSQNPAMASPDKPSPYHLDPHPRLVGCEKYVCHTIVDDGKPAVAMTPVAPLLERTRGRA